VACISGDNIGAASRLCTLCRQITCNPPPPNLHHPSKGHRRQPPRYIHQTGPIPASGALQATPGGCVPTLRRRAVARTCALSAYKVVGRRVGRGASSMPSLPACAGISRARLGKTRPIRTGHQRLCHDAQQWTNGLVAAYLCIHGGGRGRCSSQSPVFISGPECASMS
jgi:hypothetical protein